MKGPDLPNLSALDHSIKVALCFAFPLGLEVSCQVELLLGAQDEVNAIDVRNFSGLQLGIAPDHRHERIRIGRLGAPHDVPAFGICMIGDAARVDHHHIGAVLHVHFGIASLRQPAHQRARF